MNICVRLAFPRTENLNDGDTKVTLFKKKGPKVHFDRISVGERAAIGCRNPHPTPGFQRAFKVMASRRGSKW